MWCKITIGISLYIAGTVTDVDGVKRPLSSWSTLPTAQLLAWADPVQSVDIAMKSVEVTVTRDLGRLFDGVELSTMSDESIQKTILLGFAERLQVQIQVR